MIFEYKQKVAFVRFGEDSRFLRSSVRSASTILKLEAASHFLSKTFPLHVFPQRPHDFVNH